MPDIKCPSCGCRAFYVKDPNDEYDIHEFECQNGEVVFSSEVADSPEIGTDTEIHCNKCAWHGEMQACQKM
jgi:hypothetical protein